MSKSIKIKLLALAIIVAGAFFSCDPEKVNPGSQDNTISAKVNSSEFVSVNVSSQLLISGEDSTLEMAATSSDGSVIELSVRQPKVGVFSHSTLSGQEALMVYKKSAGGITVSEVTNNGSIILTKYDLNNQSVSGSFSFDSDNSEISSGEINNVKF